MKHIFLLKIFKRPFQNHKIKIIYKYIKYIYIYIKPTNIFKQTSFKQPLTSKISQNVTTSFEITYDLKLFVTKFENIYNIRSNFNYFGHSYNYDAIIGNFILLVG
jgi:hypothetical protein